MIGRKIGAAFGALALCVSFHGSSLVGQASAAQASDDAAYFTGKTVTYLSASAPGSDTDRIDRALAAEMQKALWMRVVVRNVGDRDHSNIVARIAAAPADGLTIASFSGAAVYDQLTGHAPADLRRLSWIGGAAGDPHVFVVPANSPIRTIKDLRQPGDAFVIGVSRVGSTAYVETRMLQAALHLNVRLVAGFRGGDDIRSVNNGTIDAVFGPEGLYRELMDEGDARAVLRFGAEANDDGLAKLLHDRDDGTREVVGLMQSVAALGTVVAAPPGVPARRLQALRTMFRQAVESDTVRAASPGSRPAGGRDIARAVSDALHPGPHAMALIRDTFDVEAAPVIASAPPEHSSDRTLVSFVGFTH